MLAEKNPYKYRKNRKNNVCIVNSDYVKFRLAAQDVPIVTRSGNRMHVLISLSVFLA